MHPKALAAILSYTGRSDGREHGQGQDVEATRRQQTREFSARLLSETTKMLALINGGGIVVLIAWAQAAFSARSSSVVAGFRIPLIVAMVLLLLGLSGAVLTPYFRHRLEEVERLETDGRRVTGSSAFEKVICRVLFVRSTGSSWDKTESWDIYWSGLWHSFWLSFFAFVGAALVMLGALIWAAT